jgi:3-phenylpropionate/trans-cinnamate dioxygenase ferredoxin reductase subunit
MPTSTLAIVGGGPAGVAAAATLRSEGFDGRLVMVEPDEHAPYERPPLSKAFLSGSCTQESLQLRPAGWVYQLGVELHQTSVRRISTVDRVLHCGDGSSIPYDQALVATGGTPRKPAWADGSRTITLRTVKDALALRPFVGPGAHVVIAGAGFIGCEVAATARDKGAEVTVIEPCATVLSSALSPDLGRFLGEVHREHGVQFHLGDGVRDVRTATDSVCVRLTSGAVVTGDVLVVSVGLSLNLAGLDNPQSVSSGIPVDRYCRADAPGLWAAGDVANMDHPLFGRMRVEHHDNALRQGAAAAANMLGAGVAYADVPWVWSDQYEHNLQVAGRPSSGDTRVLRGQLSDQNFTVLYLDDTKIVGAIGMNRGREITQARRMIARGARLDPALSSDSQRPLNKAALTA